MPHPAPPLWSPSSELLGSSMQTQCCPKVEPFGIFSALFPSLAKYSPCQGVGRALCPHKAPTGAGDHLGEQKDP